MEKIKETQSHIHSRHVCRGTRSCTCCKGSYTLEAAVILPLLAGFFTFLLFFFRVLQVQTGVQTALCYAGRKTACIASTTDSAPALYASAEACFLKEAEKYEVVDNYVAGGSRGVSLILSDFSGEYVNIEADYYIKLPINFFKIDKIAVSQGQRSRKWTGDREHGTEEDYVYITEHGSVYHRSRDCHYLDLSIRAVDYALIDNIRNKSEHKYYACSGCAEEKSGTGIVYITDYGVCWHTDLSCSGLKRTIYLVPLTEVGSRGPCSKCGK
ncbi:MAG: hypothetical protein NC180_00710 [Muribaculaceae bacterium]|nr:hypothetical protein [Roseburia sp.]MCM1430905.1 hypothetical protein [Muribaculaceae bacterium]MCM1491734.1 hypothetical protein [Muribaculaceae bacterium]